MNNQLSFVNKEVLNPIAFTVLGASVKTDSSSAIGWFGSGLKYAIAVMLRHNVKFTFKTHGKEYKFSTAVEDFRGEEMEIITCNGEKLGFTTEFGKQWKLEHVFRELHCNTRDEGGTTEIGGAVDSSEQTVIAIDDHRMNEEYYKRNENFLFDSAPIFTTEIGEIHPLPSATSKRVYYKGVKTQDHNRTMLYAYNVTQKIELTEDRTIKTLYNWEDNVSRIVVALTDKKLIKQIITSDENGFEALLDYSDYIIRPHITDEFLEVATTLWKKNKITAKSLCNYLEVKHPKQIEDTTKPLTEAEIVQVEGAYKLLEGSGFYPREYEIKKFEAEKIAQLGQAKDGIMYIAQKVFNMGPRELAICILEEYMHLKTGHSDMTRPFQNYLFEQIGLLMENNKDLKEKLNYQLA